MNRLLFFLVLAAAVLVGWHFLSASDESRVKETFKAMSAALDKNGNELHLETLGKARRVAALVEPGCTVEVPGKTFTLANSASDMARQIASFHMMAASLHVTFEDVSVTFTDKTTAETTCDFFYNGNDLGWSVRDARALEATLRKDPDSGRWRFARVRVVNIIEK